MNPKSVYALIEDNYPENIGRYVVATSLLNNSETAGGIFATNMNNYVNNPELTQPQVGLSDSNNNIQTALNFLIKVINNERAKENQFIQYLTKKTGITPPATSEDWKNFIQTFQKNLSLGQQELIQLENELERLKRNQRAKREPKKNNNNTEKKHKGENVIREVRDTLEYTRDQLESVIKYLGGNNEARVGREIINFIVKKYGADLFSVTVKNGEFDFELNPTQTYALLIGISQILVETFYTKRLATFYKETNGEKAYFKSALENVFSNDMNFLFTEEDNELNKQIKDLIKRTKEMPFLADDLVKNYKMIELTPLPKPSTPSDLNSENIITELRNIARNAVQVFADKELAPTIHFIKNSNNISELSTGLKLAIPGAIANINSGDAQAKTDNLIGYLSIEPSSASPEKRKEINNIIAQINQQIHILAEGLKQENTANYYTRRQNEWNDATQNIQNLLNQLKENYGELIDCFLIEESTKAYYYLYTPDNRKDFEGGSLGANIVKQIETISALQGGNLITPDQAEWLITAAINAGDGLIGHDQKPSLENYLSMFASILLFDDQQGIANEVAENMITNIPSTQTSIKKIHLFTLNNGYYPLSFILQLTFDKLYTVYNLLDSEIKHQIYSNGKNGAKVTLKGFINPDNYYAPSKKNNMTIRSWAQLSEQATKKLTMEVYFLTSAIDLIGKILNSN